MHVDYFIMLIGFISPSWCCLAKANAASTWELRCWTLTYGERHALLHE